MKAALGKKEELKDFLRKELLGTTQNIFSRRYYQITGTFDFIILVDSVNINLKELKSKIAYFEEKGLIDDVRISTIFPSSQSQGGYPLTPYESAFLNAILPNSENLDDLKENSIRVKFYNHYLYNHLEFKEDFKSINDINMPTGAIFLPEIDPHKMLHVFVRFKIADNKKFKPLLDKKKKELGTLLKTYEPIYYTNIIMCLLTAKDFKALIEFIKDLDAFSSFTEISLIFNQGFPSIIPNEVRCKPCLLPKGNPCEACPRYNIESKINAYLPRNFNEFKGELSQPIKVAIIPIKITENDFIYIMKESLKENESAEKENYTKKIIGFIKEAIKNNASIIVFPELSVPIFVLEKIEKSIKKIMEESNRKESTLIVVAGSHYKPYKELTYDGEIFKEKENVYNVSPIIFYKKGIGLIYEQFKNNTDSSDEKSLFDKLKNENIFSKEAELGKGKGCLKFDTEFGRIAVLICYDLKDNKLTNCLRKDVDIVIGVSWEKYNINTKNRNENIARESLCSWLVFSNNAKFGGSQLFGPIKNSLTEDAKQSLTPSKKNTESIKYLIIGDGIKRYQGGYEDISDENYKYAALRP